MKTCNGRWVILLLVIGVSGCVKNDVKPKLGSNEKGEINLGYYQTYDIEEPDMELTMQGVTTDSRCPMDANCSSGEAEVRFSFEVKEHVTIFSLTTISTPSKVIDGYRVRLVGLSPQPVSNKTIPKGEYVATVTITEE